MRSRAFLAYAIVTSLLELAALLAVLLWVLPAAGLVVPRGFVILSTVILTAVSVVLTCLNFKAIRLRPVRSPDVGADAVVVRSLTPEGYVRVGNELWPARCETGHVARGRKVSVVRMDRLRLVVEPADEPSPDL